MSDGAGLPCSFEYPTYRCDMPESVHRGEHPFQPYERRISERRRSQPVLWDLLSVGDKSDLNGLASQYGAVYNACRLLIRAATPEADLRGVGLDELAAALGTPDAGPLAQWFESTGIGSWAHFDAEDVPVLAAAILRELESRAAGVTRQETET